MMLYSPRLEATFIALGTTSPDFDALPRGHSRISMMQLVGKLVPIVYPTLGGPKHHHVATVPF